MTDLEDIIDDDVKDDLDKAAVENRRAQTKYGSEIGDRLANETEDNDDD